MSAPVSPGMMIPTGIGVALAAVGAVDPATADPALHLGGLITAGSLGVQALLLLGRLVSSVEALQRDGLTIHHDHGGAVAAVSDLGSAVRSHAGAVEATCEVERDPPSRVRRAG